MSYEFLTDDHLSRYGRYLGDPSPEQLAEQFYLRPADLDLVAERRHPHTKLGCAAQLVTLRFLGTFLFDPCDVPKIVLHSLAAQLGLPDVSVIRQYPERRFTPFEHQRLIRAHLGYKDFDGLERLHLTRFLYARLLLGDERPIVLFDLCTARLAGRQVILPGATTLAQLVVQVRERVATRLYRELNRRLTQEQRTGLENLVIIPDGERLTPLERLRTPPTRTTSTGLMAALERIEAIRAVGVSGVVLTDIPDVRLTSLSRHALIAWSQHLAKLSTPRRSATLLAFTQHIERSATDDVLELFDALMNSLGIKGERKRRKERLRTLRDLDGAALLLRDLARVILDGTVPDLTLRDVVFGQFGQDKLHEAVTTITDLASDGTSEETEAWQNASAVISRFLGKLVSVVSFQATPAADGLLKAMTFVADRHGKSRASWKDAPRSFVPKTWASIVFPDNILDPRAYQLCVAHQLQHSLRRRELFVERSLRYGDPRAQLLQGPAWEQKRQEVCRALDLSSDPSVELAKLSQSLDEAYRRGAEQLPADQAVTLTTVDGVLTAVVTPFEALPEPASLSVLNRQVNARLPDIDLSELLLEMNAWTGFASEMVLPSEEPSISQNLAISVCAVLVAQACNIGLKAVAQEHVPALNIGRLAWVQQHYIRADTLIRANARLVDAHTTLPLAQHWGGGEVASADGLRFVVPVRSIYTGPNSKYYGSGRGITYYTFTSDQFSQFHGIVVPGTLRDSLYILSGLLEQQTQLRPTEIMSDTAGYSDLVFGLFRLLGYSFSPRLADLGRTRYWRMDREADYGVLNDLARQRINQGLIAQHWDDILRLLGSLKVGTVRAPDVMRVLAREGSLSGLGKAIAEVGRVAKTLYLLNYLTDESYRRRIHAHLNRGEGRGKLARVVAHGHRGEIRQRFRAGMEDQLGSLGLVVNAIVLFNTRYIQASLDWLAAIGEDTAPEDVARISPLKHAHINVLGRYHFEMPDDVAAGAMRPLRDPDALDPLAAAWWQ